MSQSTNTGLVMPRRVAMQLLAAAQQGGEGGVERLVVGTDGPERLAPVPSPGIEAAIAALPEGTQPWAYFFYWPDCPTVPGVGQFEPRPQLLRLNASLATKGVLQLRAWQLEEGRVVERALSITD